MVGLNGISDRREDVIGGPCALRPQCTSAAFRCLVIHQHEPARQRARDLAGTPEFAKAQRQRKKVEALFAELKNQIGVRRLRLRRLKFVREQFFLAGGGTEYQAIGPLPKPTESAPASHHLGTRKRNGRHPHTSDRVDPITEFFNSHAC
jgi:hypothetical protein